MKNISSLERCGDSNNVLCWAFKKFNFWERVLYLNVLLMYYWETEGSGQRSPQGHGHGISGGYHGGVPGARTNFRCSYSNRHSKRVTAILRTAECSELLLSDDQVRFNFRALSIWNECTLNISEIFRLYVALNPCRFWDSRGVLLWALVIISCGWGWETFTTDHSIKVNHSRAFSSPFPSSLDCLTSFLPPSLPRCSSQFDSLPAIRSHSSSTIR
jgi:hypothetical protein